MYIVIVGCGRVGAELARILSFDGNDVVIIDPKASAFSRLGEAFNGISIEGSGISTKVLQDANISKADIFCALTNSDNINIMASQVARGIFHVPRVIARVYDPRKAEIYKTLGLDVLSETTLFASMIRDKIFDQSLSSYILETNELGTLEFLVMPKLIGTAVGELNRPGEMVVTAIEKENKTVIIPQPSTKLVKGDRVVAVAKMQSIKNIKRSLELD